MLNLKKTLLHADLTRTTTAPAGNRAGTGFGTAAITGVAVLQSWNANFLGRAAHRFFKGNLHGVAQIRATLGTLLATAPAAEYIPKDVAENITETTAALEAASHLRVNARMTKLIISRPLLFIHQDVVGFGCLFKLGIRVGVIRITIRVVLHRDTPICLLDIGL